MLGRLVLWNYQAGRLKAAAAPFAEKAKMERKSLRSPAQTKKRRCGLSYKRRCRFYVGNFEAVEKFGPADSTTFRETTYQALCQSSPNDYSEMWLEIQIHTPRPRFGALSDPSYDAFSSGWRFFGLLLC